MNVNYAVIADEVQTGEDADAAYTRMSAETVSNAKASAKVTEAMVLSGLGMTAGVALLTALEQALPGPVIRVLQSEGINVADPEAQAVIESLRGTIGDDAADWLLAQAIEVKPRWPGLKPGHVVNAIEWRTEGLI